ncbi:MAG: hypothetical protein HQ483_01785 [Rhodospirillales bacterium]|nr:hypothetical protein [Rhodospirillales bacterium]
MKNKQSDLEGRGLMKLFEASKHWPNSHKDTLKRILHESLNPIKPDLYGYRRRISDAFEEDFSEKLKNKLH